jgi:hypothetical protein
MESLIEFLAAEDQQVARQLACTQGRELACLNASRQQPAGDKTLVVMTPTDADFFGEQYLYWLRDKQPGQWAVLWQNLYTTDTGVEVAAEVHRYISEGEGATSAVIIRSLAMNRAEMRGLILFALDKGVSLDKCRIECPWMTRSVHEHLVHEFGENWAMTGLADVGLIDDNMVAGVDLNRSLNLPGNSLMYLPEVVRRVV